ncbi:hypothetical protein [Streptomyces griseus]|uniref:hypothetical protein n=1 Tax=Streptomyces griseus TaxID=1911 RepID=UPI00131B1959|nr:hypothetical protein [Streptomyces griseus]
MVSSTAAVPLAAASGASAIGRCGTVRNTEARVVRHRMSSRHAAAHRSPSAASTAAAVAKAGPVPEPRASRASASSHSSAGTTVGRSTRRDLSATPSATVQEVSDRHLLSLGGLFAQQDAAREQRGKGGDHRQRGEQQQDAEQ